MSALQPQTLVLPTLAAAVHKGHFVYVGAGRQAADADWARYIAFVETHQTRGAVTRSLVMETGTGPTVRQRKMLHDATSTLKLRVAVLTGCVVTILSWMNAGYKAFPPEKIREALDFLEFESREGPEVEATLRMLERRLNEGRASSPRPAP